MKIFHVTPDFPPNGRGIGNFVYYLSQELRRRGHEISVLFRGRQNQEYVLENVKVIEIKCAGRPPLNALLFKKNVEKILLSAECDIVHIHHGAMPAIRCNKPIIVTAHTCAKQSVLTINRPIRNLESIYRNVMFPIYVKLEAFLVHSCSRMTVVSTSLASEFKMHYGIDSEIILNAVDTCLFRPSDSCVKQDALIYTGRLALGKGLLDLLAIGMRLNISHPNVVIYIIGDGPEKEILKKYIRNKDVNNINIIGHLSHSELIEYYRRSRIYVLPTYYEGLPTTILEAMACELPVVASDVSGIPDEIDEGLNGYMVHPGDIVGFYDRITELLDDQDKQKRFGEAGRKKVLEKFTWKHVGDLVETHYQEMLARN